MVRFDGSDYGLTLLPVHYVFSSMIGGCFCFCLVFRLTEKSNRPVVILPQKTKESPREIRGPETQFIYNPENEIFFAITPEILKLGRFVDFIYC